MRIAAALCWYDEPIESLNHCITSVAPLVERIVAFDGAWRGFPHGRHRSSAAQTTAILEAAAACGVTVTPDRVRRSAWESQAAKRTALYRAASLNADWVLIIDADEELRIDDVSKVRRDLDRIGRELRPDAVLVRVATTPGRIEGGGMTATAPSGVRWQPRLLRADPSLTVGPHSHRTLSTSRVVMQCENVDDAAYHSGKGPSKRATIRGMTLVNRTHSRTPERMAAKREYGEARAHRGID